MSERRITLGEQSWPASYLSAGDLERYEAFLDATARRLHNPFVDFAEKIKVLPPDLQAVALREFMASPEYHTVPESVVIQATGTLAAIQLLAKYVTGADIEVTPANANALWTQLIEYIHQNVMVLSGGREQLAQINAMRANAGVPPIGAKAVPAESSSDPSSPADTAPTGG